MTLAPHPTAADWLQALQGLMPRGAAWPREAEATQTRFLAAIADRLAALHARTLDLSERESDPSLAAEALEDWERAFGLPEECTPLITFSRASPATWLDRQGILRTAGSNELRRDYAPLTGEDRGPLLEGAATNLLLRSTALTLSPWVASGNLGVAANTRLAPDGTTTAETLTTTSTAAGYLFQPASITAGAAHAFSLHLEAGSNAWCYLQVTDAAQANGFRAWFDVANGALGRTQLFGGGSLSSVRLDPLGNSRWRASLGGVVDGSATAIRAWVVPSAGDFTSAQIPGATMHAWGAQLEAGSSASSFIATTTAAASRAADNYRQRSVAERRAALLARMAAKGGQSRAYFIAVAAALGYPITIDEFRPPRAGLMRAGDALTIGDWCFAWRVNAPANTQTWFAAGRSAAGDPIRSWSDTTLECVLGHLKPARSTLLLSYG